MRGIDKGICGIDKDICEARWVGGRTPDCQSRRPGFESNCCRFDTGAIWFTEYCMCLLEETLKAVGPICLCVQVTYSTLGVNVYLVVDSLTLQKETRFRSCYHSHFSKRQIITAKPLCFVFLGNPLYNIPFHVVLIRAYMVTVITFVLWSHWWHMWYQWRPDICVGTLRTCVVAVKTSLVAVKASLVAVWTSIYGHRCDCNNSVAIVKVTTHPPPPRKGNYASPSPPLPRGHCVAYSLRSHVDIQSNVITGVLLLSSPLNLSVNRIGNVRHTSRRITENASLQHAAPVQIGTNSFGPFPCDQSLHASNVVCVWFRWSCNVAL